jgi:LEA14-like dessication related protein
MVQRLLVLLLALSLAACVGMPLDAIAPKVSVADVEINSISLFEQHFDVGLRLANPNHFALKIEALEFELELNGRAFAKGQSNVPTVIPASSNTVMRVDAMTQSTDLFEQIKILPETLKEGAAYRIKGRFKTDVMPGWLPYEHAGVVGGEAKRKRGATTI